MLWHVTGARKAPSRRSLCAGVVLERRHQIQGTGDAVNVGLVSMVVSQTLAPSNASVSLVVGGSSHTWSASVQARRCTGMRMMAKSRVKNAKPWSARICDSYVPS
jgi:hypothetical protein